MVRVDRGSGLRGGEAQPRRRDELRRHERGFQASSGGAPTGDGAGAGSPWRLRVCLWRTRPNLVELPPSPGHGGLDLSRKTEAGYRIRYRRAHASTAAPPARRHLRRPESSGLVPYADRRVRGRPIRGGGVQPG
jgi:hypothetical protein